MSRAASPTALRSVATIAWTNLVRLTRDRLGLFFVLVLPLLIILLFGVALGSGQRTATVGVVGSSTGALERRLLERLDTQAGVEIRNYATRTALETDVRRRVVTAGLLLPDQYDERIRTGEPVSVAVLVDPSGTVPTAVRTTLAGALARENVRLQTAQFADDRLGVDLDRGLELADAAAQLQGPVVRSETTGVAGPEVRRLDRTAAANLVLFVFLTSLVGSAALIETRRLGITSRMFAGPASSRTVLLGEALGRFVVALLQAGVVIVGAALLFGAQWENPAGIWLVVGLLSLCGTGAALLMGARFSNPEQASGVAVPLGIALGMLGGCMWPLEIVPEPMRVVGHFTPHAWAMDSLNAIVSGAAIADVTTPLAVLATFAAVLLVAAGWQLRRTLHNPGRAS